MTCQTTTYRVFFVSVQCGLLHKESTDDSWIIHQGSSLWECVRTIASHVFTGNDTIMIMSTREQCCSHEAGSWLNASYVMPMHVYKLCLVSWQIRLVWKDTGEKCQSGNGGDENACSTPSQGGPKWIGEIRYTWLEDCVQDTRDKEQQSSCVMCLPHCCFLQTNKQKNTPLNIQSNSFHLIKKCTTCDDLPGR